MPEEEDAKKLLNIRLQEKPSEILKLKPRRYQSELCDKALKKNVIIYLGTGLGKTFITVLFLTNPIIDELVQNGRRIVFLAPTQDLVKQQAEYINKQVRYKVKIFCGRNAHCGLHIDMWSKQTWAVELRNIEILFMTPQIFASAISTNLLDWQQFAAIIFDEVHHACKTSKSKESGHPYTQILCHYNDYYSYRIDPNTYPRPRMIGLTASLINSMPKDRDSIKQQVIYLERFLKATCITDVDVQDIRPKMIIHTYSCTQINFLNDILSEIFHNTKLKFNEALKIKKINEILTKKSRELTTEQERTAAYYNRLKIAAAGFSIKPNSFPKVLDGLAKVRERCGLWAVNIICDRLIQALEKHDKNSCLREDLKSIYNGFTNMIRLIKSYISEFLKQDDLDGLFKYARPKCKTLLDILVLEYKRTLDIQDDKNSFSCIVFVRSRLEVLALYLWLQKVSSVMPQYSFIKCDYAIGISATMSSKYACITKRKASEQFQMLDNFRKGYLNVIVTTSVLEEGIDLPVCSTVIRYDRPNTFREYVQSRGRARQLISSFVSVSEEKDGVKVQSDLNKFNDFEFTLKELLATSDNNIALNLREILPTTMTPPEGTEDYLLLNENKVRISSTTAKTILNMYCQRLAIHTPFTDGITYDRMQPSMSTFQTTLYLPSGCPISNKGVIGGVKNSELGADNSAIVAAVKALVEAKELNENGIPARASEQNIDELLEKSNLKPDFDILEKQVDDTIKVTIEGTDTFLYEPKMVQIENFLSKNYAERRYKLLRLTFVPIENNSLRSETKKYFDKSVFGIIIDSSTPNDFIRENLYTHYGHFKVNCQQIDDNLTIKQHQEVYLNYTHKLLHKCLQIRIRKDEFKYHCLFYIIALNNQNEPDLRKMRSSFMNSRRININDVVKVRYLYANNRRQSENRLLLVRAIRRPDYIIPDNRARRVYGEQYADMRLDSIVEVMPISKEFAKSRIMKSKRSFYSTNSIYYPEQLLELFEEDPSIVFQAYNLPEQIYNLYVINSILELERDFLSKSKTREITLEQISEPSKELVVENPISPPTIQNLELDEEDEDDNYVENDIAEPPIEGGDVYQDIEAEEISGDECSISTNDTEYTDDDGDVEEDELIGKKYKDLIGKRNLDLNDYDDDHMQKWKMSNYQVNNLRTLDFENKGSFSPTWLEETLAYQASIFSRLQQDLSPLTCSLLTLFMRFEQRITSDDTFLNEDYEFKKRDAIVDHNIIPEVKFDKIAPFKQNSPIICGLVEALTQKRALENYNLECLENLGDSYLKYVTSVILYQSVDGNEGFLTSARSRLTCNRHFTLLARIKNLGAYAITRGFSKDLLNRMLGEQSNREQEKNADIFNKMREKQLADLFESLVGSFLLYRGEYYAIQAIEWLGLNIFKPSTFEEKHEHAVVFAKPAPALIDSEENRIYYRSCRKKMGKFEEIIGYKFQDPSYLVQALTHASSTQKCTRSYERLEFLGDSILDYLVTMNLNVLTSIKTPGQMTASRSALVNNIAFAKLSIKYKYDLFLQHGNCELYDELSRLRTELEEDPDMAFLDIIEFDKIVKLLGDIFESVAGAIFLDSGCSLDKVWSVYYPMMKDSIDQEIKTPTKNIVALMHETFPGKNRILYECYDVKSDNGSSLVGIKCTIVGYKEFHGKGLSQRQAKQRAVQAAMKEPPSEEVKKRLDRDFQSQFGDSSNRKGPARSRPRDYQGHKRNLSNSYNRQSNYKPQRRYQ